MKYIKKSTFFPLLISIFLFSCSNYNHRDFKIEDHLWYFANDIIEHPDKLHKIKDYYPEIYNDNTIFENMNDSNYINNLIQFINTDFQKNNEKFKIRSQGYYYSDIDDIKKNIKSDNISLNDLFGFNLQKNNKGLSFNFIKINNNFFLLYITVYTIL